MENPIYGTSDPTKNEVERVYDVAVKCGSGSCEQSTSLMGGGDTHVLQERMLAERGQLSWRGPSSVPRRVLAGGRPRAQIDPGHLT